ncbi:FAD-binding oxidoreductase [Fluviicola sp.]|jgi:ring-1,2-phenylacetyl-CoA epoxidase subunit PaaE|uniref:FAD-binding oxidoreductase n=1 Tax=Fluviicola sp. TaxID=1917219 RepID=UPI00281A24E9|nr:FAD-binding oxidoreductase [Fluviicola sp.]MDR0802443.1 hypothetical protein [Fluviicola sp.]
MTPKFHPLTVWDVQKETRDTVSIAFEIPSELAAGYQFISSQYITIKKVMNGEELQHSHSICTAPSCRELRVAVKHINNGFSSWETNEQKSGEALEVMTPTGHFQLIPEISAMKNFILLAAYSGTYETLTVSSDY